MSWNIQEDFPRLTATYHFTETEKFVLKRYPKDRYDLSIFNVEGQGGAIKIPYYNYYRMSNNLHNGKYDLKTLQSMITSFTQRVVAQQMIVPDGKGSGDWVMYEGPAGDNITGYLFKTTDTSILYNTFTEYMLRISECLIELYNMTNE